MDVFAIYLSVAVALGLPFIALILGKRTGFKATDQEMAELRQESRQLEDNLVAALGDNERFASKAQIESLRKQTEEFVDAAGKQKEILSELSGRIDSIRADVERREGKQQELRALKAEDEAKIVQVLAAYNESSTESVALEQKLAESLRSLDTMSGEIKMNDNQRAVFQELSNALTSASAQLRDVIVDYQNANERLEGLRARFADLEREYSKLVEQQLGA
jgi:chromosome segregation ATPase